MLNWIIDISLRHRMFVLLAVALLLVGGGVSLVKLDIDAFPDTTPVQVQINTSAPSLPPEEIERRITMPIEQSLTGLPRVSSLRSISKFGLSQVVITFDDGTDIYFARQLVNERLGGIKIDGVVDGPKPGPVATGLGEVFHYVVTGQGKDATDLRTIHDWVIKPRMKVKGVAEINSWGGYEKQLQVRIDPARLVQHNVTFDQVSAAIRQNNLNVGGGAVREGAQSVLVHGVGRTVTLQEIEAIVVIAHNGVPTRVGDVAKVTVGSEIRRGAVTADGKGEVVLGLGFMLMGENTHEVTWAMKDRLNEIKSSLRPGITVEPLYDRTELVEHVIRTVKNNLLEGGLLVVAVLFAFLGNLRAALIVAMAIPLSMMFAFAGMLQFGIAASLLSLGALDFGMVVDSSVVMVENCVRHLGMPGAQLRSRIDVIREAAVEVRKPTLFGELIIMIVYLPILTLEGIEGKLYRPMALTVIFALLGSMVLSMTLMPVLASLLLPRRIEHREPLLMRGIKWVYLPVLKLAMRFKGAVIGFALIMLMVAAMIALSLGSEFKPRLFEGAIAISIVRRTGTDLDNSVAYNTIMEKGLLAEFPHEINHVWSRIGTAEIATDPMGIELTDMFIALKPQNQWTKGHSQAEVTAKIEHFLRDMPGQRLTYLQPIEMRMNEMDTGSRGDLAVQIFGDDLDELVKQAGRVESIIKEIPGAADVTTEQMAGLQAVLQIKLDQQQLARYGVPATVVTDVIEAIGSKPLGDVVDGQMHFPLVARLPDSFREGAEGIGKIMIPTSSGQLPLSRLATIERVTQPSTINREGGQRRITVSANVRGRDLGGFVADARRQLKDFTFPFERYSLKIAGQFEHLERARNRLLLVVPLVLVSIFGLLYATYGNVLDSLRVFSGVPFACVGGVIALWLRDMPFSISAGVGFVALSGVAVLDDMILVSYIRQLRDQGRSIGQAVEEAAITRLRPVLMTTLVAALGFLPMAISTGVGAEVQRPLATVVIGGVISAMVMSLLVLRVLYVVVQWPGSRKATQKQPELATAEVV